MRSTWVLAFPSSPLPELRSGGALDSTGLRKSRPGGVLRTVLYLIIVFGSKVLELKGICSFTMAT
jgi:hypothetical protein